MKFRGKVRIEVRERLGTSCLRVRVKENGKWMEVNGNQDREKNVCVCVFSVGRQCDSNCLFMFCKGFWELREKRNQTHQTECFTSPWDIFYTSVWSRAFKNIWTKETSSKQNKQTDRSNVNGDFTHIPYIAFNISQSGQHFVKQSIRMPFLVPFIALLFLAGPWLAILWRAENKSDRWSSRWICQISSCPCKGKEKVHKF